MADKIDESQKGPYKSTRTTTFEVTGPLKITTTTVEEATHVPKPCGCGGGGGAMDQLMQMLAGLASKMGQAPDGADATDGDDPADS